jgi:hypothetical protein
MNLYSFLRIGSLALVGAVLAGGLAGAQSLADVARKEEERRKANAAAAAKKTDKPKTYTNENLTADFTVPPPPPGAAAESAAVLGADKAKADAAANASAENTGGNPDVKPMNINDRGEKYWRERSAVIRGAIDTTRQQIDTFQARVNALGNDPSEQRVTQQMLTHAREALVSLEAEWENFLINARQQNVPDAWIK